MPGGNELSLDLIIRSYRENDRDGVVSLWARCGLIVPWNDPDQDLALWSDSPNAEILIGELQGRPEGQIVATTCVGHDGHRGWLYALATDPDLRKSGIGRRLVRHAEHWLTGHNIRKVQLMIRPTNKSVQDFYQSIGYEHTPRTLMARWLVDDNLWTEPTAADDGKIETTVTYLEMLGRPAISPVHPPHNFKVALMRAVSPSIRFYRYLYDAVGGPWLWWERRIMDNDTLSAIVQDDNVEIYVLYVEGVPAGFAELDRRDPAEIELAYFGLLPEFVGKGLGPYLLYMALEIAWDHEPKRLWVNTCTLDHPKALSLYQRMGFLPYRQEDKVIDDPRLTGIIPS